MISMRLVPCLPRPFTGLLDLGFDIMDFPALKFSF